MGKRFAVPVIPIDDAFAPSLAAFSITGQGTATVVLTLLAGPANTITLQSAGGAMTVNAGDVVFY